MKEELTMFEIVSWPEDMMPSRCPIHFTNERQIAASPETLWSLIVDPKTWGSFYPNISDVHLLDGGSTLVAGTRFETTLAGQDVAAAVEEFDPHSRIAWYGGPKDAPTSKAYHAWILTPNEKGTHVWMEETMKGPRWIELAKNAPDGFWLTHEKLLDNLETIAVERQNHR